MDVLFKNTHTRNKETAKEIYGYYFFKRAIYVFLYVIWGLALLFNIYSAIFEESYSILIFVCAPFVFLYPVFLYARCVNTMLSRDRELGGGYLTCETTVTDEALEMKNSLGADVTVDIGRMKSAIQTKNLILLVSDAKLIYIFDKRCFTVGTSDEFIRFLKNKGIKVKGK